jgi:hypothetical protein
VSPVKALMTCLEYSAVDGAGMVARLSACSAPAGLDARHSTRRARSRNDHTSHLDSPRNHSNRDGQPSRSRSRRHPGACGNEPVHPPKHIGTRPSWVLIGCKDRQRDEKARCTSAAHAAT